MKLKELQALYLALHALSDGEVNFKLVISDGTFTFSGEFLSFNKNALIPRVEYLTYDFDYTYSSLTADDITLLPIKVLVELDKKIRLRRMGSRKSFEYPDLLLSKLIEFIHKLDNPALTEINTSAAKNVELLSGKKLDTLLLDKNADYRVISLVVE